MTVHRIKSEVLRREGQRFESSSRKAAEAKLAEVKQRDPLAHIISIPPAR